MVSIPVFCIITSFGRPFSCAEILTGCGYDDLAWAIISELLDLQPRPFDRAHQSGLIRLDRFVSRYNNDGE